MHCILLFSWGNWAWNMSICFYSDMGLHHTSSIGMFLSGQHVWVAHHSFFELRCHYFYRAARSDLERQRTHMCLTLHQEDKNRPSLHAPRRHEVAYGLLMSPHINLRFNSESPKRKDATTSDLRGGTLHCINPPSLGVSIPAAILSFIIINVSCQKYLRNAV